MHTPKIHPISGSASSLFSFLEKKCSSNIECTENASYNPLSPKHALVVVLLIPTRGRGVFYHVFSHPLPFSSFRTQVGQLSPSLPSSFPSPSLLVSRHFWKKRKEEEEKRQEGTKHGWEEEEGEGGRPQFEILENERREGCWIGTTSQSPPPPSPTAAAAAAAAGTTATATTGKAGGNVFPLSPLLVRLSTRLLSLFSFQPPQPHFHSLPSSYPERLVLDCTLIDKRDEAGKIKKNLSEL